MLKEVRVPDEDVKDLFEFLQNKIENIEAEKELEKEETLKAIDEKYAERLGKFEKSLNEVSKVELVEVPDEDSSEEVQNETETTEI